MGFNLATFVKLRYNFIIIQNYSMRKLYFVFAAVLFAGQSYGQAIANAGMEAWRTNASGTAPVVTIQAPEQWFGFDSIVVAYGQLFGSIIGAGTDWHQQIFEEATFKNSGSFSAKVMTRKQDILGPIAGTLSNALIDVDLGILSGGGDPMSAILYSGGTAVTDRPISVSAYVAYFGGIDTTTHMMGGLDAGVITAQAIATVDGNDSVIGTGTAPILPSATFHEVTANLTYNTTDYAVHTFRVIFTSSGLGAGLDSSTLYVDDVTMTSVPQAVNDVVNGREVVRIFPNPTNSMLYLNSAKNAGYTCTLTSVSGQAAVSMALKGTDKLDISYLAAGLYLYTITDAGNNVVQRGKVSKY